MVLSVENNDNPGNPQYFWLLSKTLTYIISLSLFVGGIVILSLKIPVWSLLLGFPATQIGLVALIFTFDATLRKRMGPESFYIDVCSKCRRFCISSRKPEEKALCLDCAAKQKNKSK